MRRTIGFIFITLITTSCATTFVERENTWKPKGEVPALMVHYSVVDQYSLSQGQTVMGAVMRVVDTVTGKESPLATAGEKSFARIKPIFSHYNMKVYFDKDAANKATEIKGVVKASRTNKEGGKKGIHADGNWLHPDTVEEPFHMPGTLFQDKYYQSIAKSTLGGDKNKVAVSMGMDLNVERSWILGWVCKASFRSRVLNIKGKPVFLVSSEGQSSTHWFGGKDRYLIDACPEAAEAALAELAKVKPGTL